jgi:prepilin-type N-terminal cleavage/methylation domain-containing protein
MRSGFSLIELIFSIVIIAISVMSIPMMLQQSSKSDNFSLLQETILSSHTKMQNIVSYRWDDASSETDNSVVRVLDVKNGDSELNRTVVASSIRRKGHIVADKRRKMFDVATYPTSIVDGTNDIDDFNNIEYTISNGGGNGIAGDLDYIDTNLKMTPHIYYIDDKTDYSLSNITFTFDSDTNKSLSLPNSTNIKMVELVTTSQIDSSIPITFRTFSCNIGQSKLLRRDFP